MLFPDSSYDVLLAIGVTEFLDLSAFLSESSRVLTKGGLLGITFPLASKHTATLDLCAYTISQVHTLTRNFEVLDEHIFEAYTKKGHPVRHLGMILRR